MGFATLSLLIMLHDNPLNVLSFPWIRYILIVYSSINCSLIIKKSMINVRAKLIDSKGF